MAMLRVSIHVNKRRKGSQQNTAESQVNLGADGNDSVRNSQYQQLLHCSSRFQARITVTVLANMVETASFNIRSNIICWRKEGGSVGMANEE